MNEMNDKPKDTAPPRQADTTLVTGGRDPMSYHGFVNPPVYHASTVLYPSAEDFLAHRARYQYGRRGTPTTEALELALQELEGSQCAGVSLLPSGLAAIASALLAVVHAGDHVLVTDSAYGPSRTFCDQVLARLGLKPLLDLGMRLGEGSGAALAIGLAKAALACHLDMATFDSAGVSQKSG